MPSTNKTEFLGLNQWQGNEYPKRQDFVDDNKKIDDKMKELDSVKADKSDLDNINIPVQSVNGKTGDVVLSATDIKASDGKTLEQFKSETTTQMDNFTQDLNNHIADTVKHITDAERNNWNTKLDASQFTSNNVLTKLKAVDGAGSGLDADTLDGKHLSDIFFFEKIAEVTPATDCQEIALSNVDTSQYKALFLITNDTKLTDNNSNFLLKINDNWVSTNSSFNFKNGTVILITKGDTYPYTEGSFRFICSYLTKMVSTVPSYDYNSYITTFSVCLNGPGNIIGGYGKISLYGIK